MKDKEFKILRVYSFLDFCIRCEEIYAYFWENFAPFFDIAIYRDYLLEEVPFSQNAEKQEMYAGLAWEFLMGDIFRRDLYSAISSKRVEYEENYEDDSSGFQY